MASLVLGIAGAAALGPAGLAWGGIPALGLTGAQIGFMGGSMLGSSLTKMPDIQIGRLSDLDVQDSKYGTPIPIYYGTDRGAGQVIWSTKKIPTEHEESSGGLGKGGPSQSVTNYTYHINCAIGVCGHEIAGIRRIWANGNLIYDQSTTNTGHTGQNTNIRIYTGSETQVADSLLESYLGAGNVPGFRGLAYVVFENFQLEKYGNQPPQFSFEVVESGTYTTPTPTKLTETTPLSWMQHPFIDGLYLTVSADNGGSQPYVLHATDAISKTDRSINVANIASTNGSGAMCYVEYSMGNDLLIYLNEIWVHVNSAPTVAVAFDATTLAFKRMIQPSASIGLSHVGRMQFDEISGKVIFATSSFGGTQAYNALNAYSLVWDGVKNTDAANDVYTGTCISGNNSVALSNYNTFICFFINGQYVHKETVTQSNPYITYDTLRERYAIWDRNVSSKSVFKTFSDNGIFSTTEYTPNTVSMPVFRSFNYFPVADKYILSDGKIAYLLNADTFETEDSWTIFTVSGGVIYDCIEIPSMPEYMIATVTQPTIGLALVPITNRLTSNPVTLSSVVTDICARVGLAAGDIDVTGLTDQVEGYTIGQQMTARAAIDGLQAAFYFDAVESD